MPHIVFEATPFIGRRLDFQALALPLHRRLDQLGYARLDDLKSRLHVGDAALAGADPDAEFLVARLLLTNPRSDDMKRAMAREIHDAMCAAVRPLAGTRWWQCCVLTETHDKTLYQKTDSHAAPGQPG